MNASPESSIEPTLAKSVAAEDLACGDFVAFLSIAYDYPSFLWPCDSHLGSPGEVIRMRFQTNNYTNPLKVRDICLPFVFVKLPDGRLRTIDIRNCELVRLDRQYGQRVWKALADQSKRSERRGRKNQRCKKEKQ